MNHRTALAGRRIASLDFRARASYAPNAREFQLTWRKKKSIGFGPARLSAAERLSGLVSGRPLARWAWKESPALLGV